MRDRLLQLMGGTDGSLDRQSCVMTPDVDRLGPLLVAVFGRTAEHTACCCPWRLTDRSQQGERHRRSPGCQTAEARRWNRLHRLGLPGSAGERPLQEPLQLDAAEPLSFNGFLAGLWLPAEGSGGRASAAADCKPQAWPGAISTGSSWPGATRSAQVLAAGGCGASLAVRIERIRPLDPSAHQLQQVAHERGHGPTAAAPGARAFAPPASAVCSAMAASGAGMAALIAKQSLSDVVTAGSCTLAAHRHGWWRPCWKSGSSPTTHQRPPSANRSGALTGECS